MTDPAYCDITIVADRSWSMTEYADPPHTKAQRSTDGIRQLVADQKALPGKVRFSLVHFDTDYEWVARAASSLEWTCQPRGGTALLDAVGHAITETGERLAAMPEDERPGKVIFVIATDGEENSSREYTLDTVKQMITDQHDTWGWDFAYIGVDLDAFGEAARLGVATASTLPAGAVAMAAAYNATSGAISHSRSTGAALCYSDEQRATVEQAGHAGKAWQSTR